MRISRRGGTGGMVCQGAEDAGKNRLHWNFSHRNVGGAGVRPRVIDRIETRMIERTDEPARRVAVVEPYERNVESAHHVSGAGIHADKEIRQAHHGGRLAQAQPGVQGGAGTETLAEPVGARALLRSAVDQEMRARPLPENPVAEVREAFK